MTHKNDELPLKIPYVKDTADVHIVPIPWQLTVSCKLGTIWAPEEILKASAFIDLSHPRGFSSITHGAKRLPAPLCCNINDLAQLQEKATSIIRSHDVGRSLTERQKQDQREINIACDNLMKEISEIVVMHVRQGKTILGLGGDHSVTSGLISGYAREIQSFGILQIDAHMDLRSSYQGFRHSHAATMFNALTCPEVSRLTQVGVRDFCKEEMAVVDASHGRISSFLDWEIKSQLFQGKTWHDLSEEIVETLPELVYLTIDIDGLLPSFSPNTGTPVPGGLTYDQVMYLLARVYASGRRFIGADLVEVVPEKSGFDQTIAAHLLYGIFGYLGK